MRTWTRLRKARKTASDCGWIEGDWSEREGFSQRGLRREPNFLKDRPFYLSDAE